MNTFYKHNITAFFLGDGRLARADARLLYLDYGIESLIFDDKPSIISKMTPYIKTVSTRAAREDELVLHLLFSHFEKMSSKTVLLIAKKEGFKALINRNRAFLETHFILNPEVVLKNLNSFC